MSNQVKGAFSVRFLRNGDQIGLECTVVNEDGAGVALSQAVDTVSGTPSPNWETDTKAQPIIRIRAFSMAGYAVSVTNVRWAYDGNNLTFPALTSSWQTDNSGMFRARVNGSYYELRIIKNIASATVVSNRQITYTVEYVSNAMTGSVTGSKDINIQQAGASSYYIEIATNRVRLDAENPSTVLTATARYGLDAITIGSGGFTVKWLQSGAEVGTGATLTVTRDMVAGGAVFTAQLLYNGDVVSQDGQRINDVADTYQITYQPASTSQACVSESQNSVWVLGLECNGSPVTSGVTFSSVIYNAMGVVRRSNVAGSQITITASDALCTQQGGGTYYADVEVEPTAEF